MCHPYTCPKTASSTKTPLKLKNFWVDWLAEENISRIEVILADFGSYFSSKAMALLRDSLT